MIRVEPDAQKTNAYQENRNLLLSDKAHADSIPASRSWRTTSAAPTARRWAASTASSSST
jgi:Fe-S cluster assembly protein SufD